MNKAMNPDYILVTVLKAVNRLLLSMRRTIIDDPEHASCFTIRRLGHYLIDQSTKSDNAGLFLTAAKIFSPVHIKTDNIGNGSAALVFVFNLHRCAWYCRVGVMNSMPSLDTCFFIRRNYVLVFFKVTMVPHPFHRDQVFDLLLRQIVNYGGISRCDNATA